MVRHEISKFSSYFNFCRTKLRMLNVLRNWGLKDVPICKFSLPCFLHLVVVLAFYAPSNVLKDEPLICNLVFSHCPLICNLHILTNNLESTQKRSMASIIFGSVMWCLGFSLCHLKAWFCMISYWPFQVPNSKANFCRSLYQFSETLFTNRYCLVWFCFIFLDLVSNVVTALVFSSYL